MTTEASADRDFPDPDTFETASDWASALRRLRESAGLSIRDLARETGASTSTLGGYFAARHVPSLASKDVIDKVLLACGVSDAAMRQAWLEALNRVRRIPGPRPADAATPYLGLASYGVQDARWFCGREALAQRLIELVESGPEQPVMVVGASGSGKSSLISAGVLAALIDRGWSWLRLTPGEQPLQTLDQALDQALDRARNEGSEAGGGAAPSTLVVVDQLEELWTAGAAPLEVASAIDALARLAGREGVVVVTALRADFYASALASPTLATALQTHQVVVGPMALADLRRAVTEPALRARLELDDGLVDVVLRDLAPGWRARGSEAYEPGALPLLSHALLQTWQRGGRYRLTIADYAATGGIDGAVSASAEAVFAELDEGQQELTRRLFMRLVSVGEETADTRRRVSHAELSGLGSDPASGPESTVDELVRRFVAARLLTADESTVTITHEALLSAWPRLRSWLDTDRAGVIALRRLAEAADGWQAADRDPSMLFRGGRLESAREWAHDPARRGTLNTRERDFLAAALAARDGERGEQLKRTRRLQLLAAALTAALVVVAILAGYSTRIRTTAEHDRDLALSRQLAEAANRLRSVDPSVAAQFALLGYRSTHTVEATSALLNTGAEPLDRRFEGPGGPAAVAVSGDGRVVAAVGDRGGLRLWTLAGSATSSAPTSATGPTSASGPIRAATITHVQDGPLYTVAVNRDGTLLAVAGAGGLVHLYDVRAPSRPRALPSLGVGEGGGVLALAFSPNGRMLAATSTESIASGAHRGLVYLWDVEALNLRRHPGLPLDPSETGLQAIAFSSDGGVLAAAGDSGTVYRWALLGSGAAKSLAPKLSGPGAVVTSLAFARDGHALAAGSRDQRVYVWPLARAGGPLVRSADGAPMHPDILTQAQSRINVVSFSADGKLLAAGGSDSHLRIYDYPALTLATDVGQPGPITGAAFAPDDRSLITGGADGRVHLWAVPTPAGGIAKGRTFGLAYLAKDRLLALTSGNTMRVFDTSHPFADEPITGTLSSTTAEPFAGTLAVSRNRHLFASAGQGGSTWLYRSDSDAALAQPVSTLPKGQSSLVESATFANGGQSLLTADDGSTLQVTDVTDPQAPTLIGSPLKTRGIIYALAATPAGRLVASGTGTAGLVELWDLSNPAKARVIASAPAAGSPTLQVYGLAFSPDGRTLAVGAADHTVRLLDVTKPASPRWIGAPLSGSGDYVFAVQFSPDGRTLASASNDGSLRVYDVSDRASPQSSAVLTGPVTGGLYSVAFAPDGRSIAAGGASEQVFTWTLDPEQAARRICALIGDPVPAGEWHRYLPSVPYSRPCAP